MARDIKSWWQRSKCGVAQCGVQIATLIRKRSVSRAMSAPGSGARSRRTTLNSRGEDSMHRSTRRTRGNAKRTRGQSPKGRGTATMGPRRELNEGDPDS